MVCGVHYPTDMAGSKSIAGAMIRLLINDPQFKEELNEAKAETRRALGL
jgi:acid phosphatase (class A)